ncbi:MAG: flagellar brake protein [Thermaerobacterales bacterium]
MPTRNRLPKIAESVILEIPNGEDEEKPSSSFTTVAQNVEGGTIEISWPMMGQAFIEIEKGQEVVLRYTDGSAAYRLEAQVVGKKERPVALIAVGAGERIQRIQRRDFVRLDMRVPVRVQQPVKGEEDEKEISQPWHPGRTLDVSGGGVRLMMSDILEMGDDIALQIQLGERWIEARGKIVRRGEALQRRGMLLAEYGVSFIFIEEEEQDYIIRFLFEAQRVQRQSISGRGG